MRWLRRTVPVLSTARSPPTPRAGPGRPCKSRNRCAWSQPSFATSSLNGGHAQIPGNKGINPSGIGKSHTLKAKLPSGVKCTGTLPTGFGGFPGAAGGGLGGGVSIVDDGELRCWELPEVSPLLHHPLVRLARHHLTTFDPRPRCQRLRRRS